MKKYRSIDTILEHILDTTNIIQITKELLQNNQDDEVLIFSLKQDESLRNRLIAELEESIKLSLMENNIFTRIDILNGMIALIHNDIDIEKIPISILLENFKLMLKCLFNEDFIILVREE